MGHEHALDHLRGHVLASGGDDDILFPVGDAQVPVLVDFADVAGMEPPVLRQDLFGVSGPVVIPLHHLRPPDQHLAIIRDFALGPRERRPARAELYRLDMPEGVEVGNRRRLCQAVAQVYLDAHGLEEFPDAVCQRRAPDAHDNHPVESQCRPQLGKYYFISQPVSHAEREGQCAVRRNIRYGLFPGPDRDVEKSFLAPRRVPQLRLNPLVELLEHPRHVHAGVRPDILEVRHQRLRTLRVSDRSANLDEGVIPYGALKRVRERQERDAEGLKILLREGVVFQELLDVYHQVVMGEHYPLGVAGRARSVDEGRGLIEADPPQALVHLFLVEALPSGLERLVEGDDHLVLVDEVVHDYDLLEAFQILLLTEEIVNLELARAYADFRPGIVQDVPGLGARVCRIYRDVRRAYGEGCDVGNAPFRPVVGIYGDPVFRLDSLLYKI